MLIHFIFISTSIHEHFIHIDSSKDSEELYNDD